MSDDRKIRDFIAQIPEIEQQRSLKKAILHTIRAEKPPNEWFRRFSDFGVALKTMPFVPNRVAFAIIMVFAICAVTIVRLNLLPGNQSTGVAQMVEINFTFQNEEASRVSVVGTFNQWNSEKSPMIYDELQKSWMLRLKVPPGRYEYGYLIDGQRVMLDPNAPFIKDDGWGSQNSLIIADDILATYQIL
ncbi:hypothetical protein QUF70_02935 [Desulfobacterales bacterium HSG17]|nr:hypothetical protein [Desulfobacterales bacterium HSG17]